LNNKKKVAGKTALSEAEKLRIANYDKKVSEWLKAQIQISGKTRDDVAIELSTLRGRDISRAYFDKMLNSRSYRPGFIFEICEIIGVDIVAIPRR
jgi:spore coat protein CotH